MIIKSFILPPIENNNYLIIDEHSKEAALVDCSAVSEQTELDLKKNDATLKYILLTHGHFDHIAGLENSNKTAFNFTSLKVAENYINYLATYNY
jgi:glyoxylase-like metal-dependent hydrolase (beta-lactamase superfamily II)